MMAFNIANDFFSISADASLNVLTNDTTGAEVQSVSAFNQEVQFADDGTFLANVIPDRPGLPGTPQRSVYPGALTLLPTQANRGDSDLYLDTDSDPSNDSDETTLQRLNQSGGLVLGTLRDNSELNAAGTNLAVVQYTANAAGDSWIATNAAPNNDGEQAADFSAAYFPYAAGWRGASFDGETRNNGDAGFNVTGSGGVYEVSVGGVVDSLNDGFLFAIGGDNSDNYTRTMPLGGDRWSIIHRDNSNGFGGSDGNAAVQRFNLLYVPRNAQGLIGGTVYGNSTGVNPMLQSFGDFDIQRQSDGLWKLTVPGQDITTGMVVMENADTGNDRPRNTYFTYDVDPTDPQAILLRQFDANGGIDLKNENFNFFFIPFDGNTLAPAATDLAISRLGSSAAGLGDNVSSAGVPLSINADGTVGYATGTSIRGLGQGESVNDTFVYEVLEEQGGVTTALTATATIVQLGVNDKPFSIGQPSDLEFFKNAAGTTIDASSFFDDFDVTDTLTYSVEFVQAGIAGATVSGSGITITPAAGATGTTEAVLTATDNFGAAVSVSFGIAVTGISVIDDSFFISSNSVLSVLNNDSTGSESPNVSAMNVLYNRDTIDKPSNFAEVFIPLRPDGGVQRSTFSGAITTSPSQTNHADIPIYLDLDTDFTNDADTSNLQRLSYTDGIVLGTGLDNSPLDETATNLGLVKYTGFTGGVNAAITTDAGPENDGERATDFSAAYFPYASGWVGGSYNGDGSNVAGGTGLTVTGDGGQYVVEVAGVTNSFDEGFLFSIGGTNGDNYARSRPIGGNRWLVQHRDNASDLNGSEGGAFNVVYVPRSATGLVGGVVNGSSDVVNPMRQSFGNFQIQRQQDGFWRVSVPGESPTSGVLVMETVDRSSDLPRNSYFTYEADPDSPDDFLIRQFDYTRNPSTANPRNGDFVFFFIPFENQIQSSTPIMVDSIGSTEANPTDNLTTGGVSISLNPDGTVNYDAGSTISALGEGQTGTDTFYYSASFEGESVVAEVTINLVGANDAPVLITDLGELEFVEDGSTTLDLATAFSDVDTGDTLTYSVSFNRSDIAAATVTGSSVTIGGLPDRFGYVLATITATDSLGATASTDVPILITAAADGPIAVADAASTVKTSAINIDVLANDVHPDAGRFQVAGANLFADNAAVDDEGSVWTVTETGTGDNAFTIESPPNLGDVAVGLNGIPLTFEDGILFGTAREDSGDFTSVNTYLGFDSAYTFATARGAGGNGERNVPIGAAMFPFAENWIGGHISTEGNLLIGNGVNQSNVSRVPDTNGLFTISIPGVTDSNTDGLLFAMGGNNDDNLVTAVPLGGNSWLVRQLDNDADDTGFENDGIKFIYVPINNPGLTAGRYTVATGGGEEDPDGGGTTGVDLTAGTFTATANGIGTVTIDIPGASPTDGALMVMPTGTQSILLPDGSTQTIPVANGAFYAATADGNFQIETRRSGTFELTNSSFQFVYIPFANPLRTALSSTATNTVTAVDATSSLGATLSIAADGTILYDPTTAGPPISTLAVGESVIDTFSYTITDGAGQVSTTTTEVEVFGGDVAPAVSGVFVAGSSWSAEVIDQVDGGGAGAGNGLGFEIVAGAAPIVWSNVDRIYVQFSEDVLDVTAADVALLGGRTADYGDQLTVSYDAATFVATISLSAAFEYDKLRLAINDTLVDANGNSLDGDGVDGAGGIFDLRMDVLPGDASGDARISAADLQPFGPAFGAQTTSPTYSAIVDWNADGRVSAADLSVLGANFGLGLNSVDEPGNASFPPSSPPSPGLMFGSAGSSVATPISAIESTDKVFAGLGSDDAKADRIVGRLF